MQCSFVQYNWRSSNKSSYENNNNNDNNDDDDDNFISVVPFHVKPAQLC